MGPLKVFLLSAAWAFLLLVATSPSYSGMAIELSNGATITADGCRDAGSSLLCSKMGGEFEIEKKDIVRIMKTEGDGAEGDGGGTAEGVTGDSEKTGAGGGGEAAGKTSGDATSASAKRLEEIRQRKIELQKERDKLAEERQRLQKDVDKAADWMPSDQFDELSRRNSELDTRIKAFNEEVRKLNEEERAIVGASGTGNAGTPQPAGGGPARPPENP